MKGRIIAMCIAGMLVLLAAGCAGTPSAPSPTPAKPAAPPPTSPASPTLAPSPTKVPTIPPSAPATPAVSPTPAPSPTTAPTAPPSPTAKPATQTTLQWFGHSTFLLTTASGTKILMDPMTPMGYTLPTFTGLEAVTVSHEHGDHNNVALAGKEAAVIRGLSGSDWAKIDQKVKEVAIRTMATYHDDTQGSKRGKNALFIFQAEGLTIVHLGDLGHKLTPEQVNAIGKVDVLLIPVGGYYTIDGATAKEVAQQLAATILIPMHYKTPKLQASWPGETADSFLAGMAKVERPGKSTFAFTKATLPSVATVVVLNYE